ncbi:hypothetical protein ABT324_12270 [Saccharopolyspora sp. NPDC000359]|uniref:hypothetical protein n=1 Tax=Saccharopolyspora sp. NPDC000359 TaxID=3154251 RepID=UPI00331BD26C
MTRPDGSTFDVEQDKPLPAEVVPRTQPGMVVRVRYLPRDESEVLLVSRANS